MICEQLTITGELEIIDPLTCQVRARKCTFTASRACVLYGESFAAGDQVEATFPASVDLEAGKAKSGPWGGYTSRWIRDHATQIVEMGREKELIQKKGQ